MCHFLNQSCVKVQLIKVPIVFMTSITNYSLLLYPSKLLGVDGTKCSIVCNHRGVM